MEASIIVIEARNKLCELCQSIIDKKAYRSLKTISSVVYREYIEELGLESKGFLCSLCVNKINRLHRLDMDIMTKVDALKAARNKLFSQLQEMCKSRCKVFSVQRPKPVRVPKPPRKKIQEKSFANCMKSYRPLLPLTMKTSSNPDDDTGIGQSGKNKKRKSSSAEKSAVQVKKTKTSPCPSTSKPQSILESGMEPVMPSQPVLLVRNINTVMDEPVEVTTVGRPMAKGLTEEGDHFDSGASDSKGNFVLGFPSTGIKPLVSLLPANISVGAGSDDKQENLNLCQTNLPTTGNVQSVQPNLNLSQFAGKDKVHVNDPKEPIPCIFVPPKSNQDNMFNMVILNQPHTVQNSQTVLGGNSEAIANTDVSHNPSNQNVKVEKPGSDTEDDTGYKRTTLNRIQSDTDPSVMGGSHEMLSSADYSIVRSHDTESENNLDSDQQSIDVCPDNVNIKQECKDSYIIPKELGDGSDDAEFRSGQPSSSPEMVCIKQEPEVDTPHEYSITFNTVITEQDDKGKDSKCKKTQDPHPKGDPGASQHHGHSKPKPDSRSSGLTDKQGNEQGTLPAGKQTSWQLKLKLRDKIKTKQGCDTQGNTSKEIHQGDSLETSVNQSPSKQSSSDVATTEESGEGTDEALKDSDKQLSPDRSVTVEGSDRKSGKLKKGAKKKSPLNLVKSVEKASNKSSDSFDEGSESGTDEAKKDPPIKTTSETPTSSTTARSKKRCMYNISIRPDKEATSVEEGDFVLKLEPAWH